MFFVITSSEQGQRLGAYLDTIFKFLCIRKHFFSLQHNLLSEWTKIRLYFRTKLLPFELGKFFEPWWYKIKSLHEKWSSWNWLFCIDYVQAYTKHSKCNGYSHSYFNIIGKIQYFLIISVYELVPVTCKDSQEKKFEHIKLPNRLKTHWLVRRIFYVTVHTFQGI